MTLIWMILILGIIVFVHEFGHFIFAKKAGIYVYEFSLGMGPRLFKFNRKNDETEYSIRLFPIGGYVQMAGEEIEEDKNIPEEKRMQSKSWIQRFMTIIAGIMFNFILAIVVFFIIGLVNGASQNKPYINLVEDSINSDLVNVGDRIIAVNGKKIIFTDVFVLDVQLNSGKPLNLTVSSDGVKRDVVLNPIQVEKDGKVSYKYGIGLGDEVKTGVLPALKYAFVKFVSLMVQMFLVVVNLFTGKLGLSSMSGPVGIFNVVGESAQAGFINLVYLVGFISLNVGFMNLLPIPALDGGRILFLIIEKIKGSKVDVKVENTIHTIGFVLLMILMLVITFNDIIKLF
ncbi:MAG: M50 family metallopeptidase [Bacilli bacterium]